MSSMTVHKEACIQAFALYDQETSDYESLWPNHCRRCNARGGVSSAYDPSPAGVSLGSGWMEDFDTCGECADHRNCPRCAGTIPGQQATLEAGVDPSTTCPHCGWSPDDASGFGPEPPECLCWMAEV
jgi:hypothetical protein